MAEYFATIDAENFPTGFYTPAIHGTNIPVDAVEITEGQWQELVQNHGFRKLVDGEVVAYTPPPHIPTVEEIQAPYRIAIEELLDAKAKEKRYDNAVSISTYVNSRKKPEWAAEASLFIDWRDDVWDYAYEQFDAVLAGTRPQPTVAELIAELPTLTWPA